MLRAAREAVNEFSRSDRLSCRRLKAVHPVPFAGFGVKILLGMPLSPPPVSGPWVRIVRPS